MDQQLYDQLKEIIVSKLNISDASKIVPDARFREDLHADSLDTYELVYAIEEQMNITIPPEKASTFERVKDAMDFIESQKK
ncbi:MAG: acyl carrier protein [Spirochaetia bacterium]